MPFPLPADVAISAPDAMGVGHAFGAVSILNATATGIGCSLAIQASTQATWRWTDAAGFTALLNPVTDDALCRAVWTRLRSRWGRAGAAIEVHAPFPASRGLKASSSVAAALVQAASRAAGEALSVDQAMDEAIAASLEAKVTLTGAFDDQVAVVRGGCHITDNRARQVLAALEPPARHVALWVPTASIPKARLRGIDATPVRREAEAAAALARRGDVGQAMTTNGAAFHRLYRAAGLPVDDRPTHVALHQGALGAGLSGTGPAVAALFDKPTPLPEVDGGTWHWTQVQL